MENPDLIQRLSATLFWDVEVGELDAAAHQRFIIPRVMDRGGRADVRAVWRYYGSETVRSTLLSTRSLDAKTIAFFANQFGLRPEAFRAFNQRQEMKTWLR